MENVTIRGLSSTLATGRFVPSAEQKLSIWLVHADLPDSRRLASGS
jgi:hypothetical protein